MIKKKNFFLKLFTFRTLKILWFNCFRLKKHMYCQIRLGLLYCFAVLFIVIAVSNISPRKIMKSKATPYKRNHPLPPSKDMLKISPETRTSNFN